MQPISIPTRPYIKKFILKTLRQSEPIHLQEDITAGIGRMAMGMLMDKRAHVTTNEAYTATLALSLPAEMRKRKPQVRYLVNLNKYFENLFHHSLITWVHAQGESGIAPYPACSNFLEYYNIKEEEYRHASAYRAWLREKNNEYTRARKKSISRAS